MGRNPKSATENTLLTGQSDPLNQTAQQHTLPAISHSAKRTLIALDRNTLSIEGLRKLFHEARMKHDETIKLLNPMGDADNNYSSVPYSHELYTDKHFHFDRNGDSVMDIVFGQNLIFFVIYSKVLARHLGLELDLEDQSSPKE